MPHMPMTLNENNESFIFLDLVGSSDIEEGLKIP